MKDELEVTSPFSGDQEFKGSPYLNGEKCLTAEDAFVDKPRIGYQTNMMYQRPRMILNPDTEVVNRVIQRIQINDGNCPCQPSDSKIDNRCPCPRFISKGECHCSLFVKADK